METPVSCISEDSREPSLPGSYDHLDTYLWRQDIKALMDPDSSTLSSSSFCPALGPPAFYLPATFSSLRKHRGKAGQKEQLPRSQKTPSTRAASLKVPFILDQSKKVSAVRAPSQKTSTAPGPTRRAPAVPAAPQKTPVARGPSRRAPPAPTTSPKAPAVHGTARKAPPASAVSRKAVAVPAPSRKAPPVSAGAQKPPAISAPSHKAPPILALPPKPVSPPLRRRKSLFIPTPSQKAVTSPPQPKMTLERAELATLPELSPRREAPERRKHEGMPQPMLFVGTQEMDAVETRTQRTSMELPFSITKKRSEEVVISKAREITLDGLKGRGTLEDKVHKKKEKISLDMPGFKSKKRGEQQRWLKTQKVAIDGGPEEQIRPFSVEALTLAKMMIAANCKEPPQRPAAVGLPSWVSAPQVRAMSTEGTAPFRPHQVPSPEGKPVGRQSPLGSWVPSPEWTTAGVREQSLVGSWVPSPEGTQAGVREQSLVVSWVKGKMHWWAERRKHHWAEEEAKMEELSQDTTAPSEVPYFPEQEMDSISSSQKMDNVFQSPIPQPASEWEDAPRSPISLTPISEMDAGVSPQLSSVFQEPQELQEVSDLSPLTTTGLSSEALSPSPLEVESTTDMATNGERTEEQDLFSPSARYLGDS